MGTNWFIPAFVKSKPGESGIKLEDGTMVCPFDLKKFKKDCRISAEVIPLQSKVCGIKIKVLCGGLPGKLWNFAT
jgi:hypothetical protein